MNRKILFFASVIILNIQIGTCELPPPVAFYDFEFQQLDIVEDKGSNNRDAEIIRPNQVNFDSSGAIRGSTPGTSINFQGGYLDAFEISLDGIINDVPGQNSYTFSAWIKPSDLNGNKFLWGQTSQGIHNGIRNGGFLHQAHWGADTNGKTNLNNLKDQWIHAAWVYDGDSDEGTMYLNGEIDWQGAKRAPNGSGTLIIGGSNGGGDNYRGLADDIAIWDQVLDSDEIALLAAGLSPINAEPEDEDEDGIPDGYEIRLFGNLTTLGEGDYDKDGLEDLLEFEGTTSPVLADTDDDGLSDGIELNKETDPNNPDTDNDGLNDGDEFALGTDPNNKDSDDDGYDDGVEVTRGSDPADAENIPDLSSPIAYYSFESRQNNAIDRAFNNHTAFATGSYTLVDEGAPDGASPGAAIQLEGGHLRVPSIDMNLMIRDRESGNYTMSAWIKPLETGGERFLFGQTNQGIHHGIRNGGYLHSAHWGADWNASTNLNDYLPQDDDGWIHAAWVYDGAIDEAHIYLDGELDGSLPQRSPNGGGHLIIGARNNGERQFIGLVDEVAIWNESLSSSEIKGLANGESPIKSLADQDNDGFADVWELQYADTLDILDGNNEESDFDEDGLTNWEEYLLGLSNPTESDSDNDGLDDFTEVDDGTNPLNPDSDEDGLSDKDEITAQTDPTNPDTDGDSYLDGIEIKSGSDPKDSNSTPDGLMAYYSFEEFDGETLIDGGLWENNAIVARPNQTDLGVNEGAPEGPSPQSSGRFNDGLLDVPGIDLSRIISGEGSYTFSAWLKPSDLAGDKFIFGQSIQGIHNGIRNNGFLHQAHWGADTNGITDLNDYLGADDDGWIHAVWTYDGETDTGQIYLDGKLDWEGEKRSPNGSGNLIIGGRNGGGNGYFGLIDEIAIWDNVISEEFIKALADGASPLSSQITDEDEDGLPDWWEEKYDVDNPSADPDNDGLKNSEEFVSLTNPNEPDSDNDGVQDGQELKDKTSPIINDTDSDGLSDGEEKETGTNPLLSDTDGDGFSDGGEIAAGSDPLKANIVPDTALPILYYDFEGDEGEIVLDKSGKENNATVGNPGNTILGIDGGAPEGSTPETAVELNNGLLRVPNLDLSEIIQGSGSYTFSAWLKPTDLSGDKFLFGQTSQGIHNGIRNNGFLHQAHWGADTNGSTNLNNYLANDEDGWIHATWTYDGETDTGQIYLDGELDWEGDKRSPNGSGSLIIGGRNGGENGYVGFVDEVAVWDSVIAEGTIISLAQGASPIGRTLTDEDEDGLPDFWEERYEVDNPLADNDNDGLNNLEEYKLKTNPKKADTDSDGLTDGREKELSSSPLLSDSDSDGLNDKEEIDAGTNPIKADSDDDGFSDLKEIEVGSNPIDSNSIPPTPPADEPLFFFDFEGDEDDRVLDKGERGNDGIIVTLDTVELGINEGAPRGSTGSTSVRFNNGHIDVPGVPLDEIIAGDGSYTMAAWLKPENLQGNKFLFGQTVQGIHNGIRNGGFLHQAHWGADTNGETNLNNYIKDEDDGWIHATWTYDAENDIGQIYLDGKLDWEGAKRAPNGSGNLIIGGRSGGGDGYIGLADDIVMWDSVLAPELISELASGSSPIGANLPFQITSISYFKETNQFELTWDSKPGRTYMLLYNLDLDQWDADIDDAIDSGGETTTYRFENPEGPNTRRLFFKVIEN